MASASVVRSAIQANLAHELICLGNWRVHTELTLEINGDDYIPDVCAYPHYPLDLLQDEVRTPELPPLVIEIISPRQTSHDILKKIRIYRTTEIESIWLVTLYPPSVTVFTKEKDTTFHEGTLVDQTLGIRLEVSSIFQ